MKYRSTFANIYFSGSVLEGIFFLIFIALICTAMKKLPILGFTVIVFFNLFNYSAFAQQFRSNPMSSYDSLRLSQLPPLILSQIASRTDLPPVIDNSSLPWFRPIFSQDGYDCGQAASIGYQFTYEINRLRELPADVPENQYATWFSYNFINQGMYEVGVSYFETYEILKYAGNPTVEEYGGMSFGGMTRWMNGYDLYYSAMHNRLLSVNSVNVSTPEGIQTMKNWIYDHGNGSTSGGLGVLYASLYATFEFPPDVPEAGKTVITYWGPEATHALTIVGYNDSIRWDYNNDGQYTNDVDLDGDGIIGVRDWEIGGFKIANSYGDEWFGDEGFAYVMYKSVADQYGQGGIWNNSIVVIDVNDNQEPQLTAKVSLSHDCRRMLSISCGVSADPEATEPEHIMHFPMFDFQGGCFPMQGDTVTEPLELGLDLSLLLAYVNPGEPARYFLMIQEDDPQGAGSGTLESFSIIDYTNGVSEISSGVSAMPVANNSVTTAYVNAGISYDAVEVTTDTIMPIQLYTDFSLQMQASGGTPPYRWHFSDDYIRDDSTAVMPVTDGFKLQPSSHNAGKALVNLPFAFPFYGKEYSEIYVTVDGYLMFEDTEIPWPYVLQGRTYFIETPMIAPGMCFPFEISGSTQGIWYEEDSESVIFRWCLGIWGVPNGIFNATVRLYPDGRIELNYGECIIPVYVKRYAGISNGDGENYEILSYSADFNPVLHQMLIFTPSEQYSGISLTPDGLLLAQCQHPLDNTPITLCVTDKNNIRDYKTFSLNTTGLQMNYEIISGNDNKLEYGEEASMDMTVTNLNGFPLNTMQFTFDSEDPYITITDNVAQLNSLQPGESVTITNAFSLVVADDLPDTHYVPFSILANASESDWQRDAGIKGYRPVVRMRIVSGPEPGNGIPEPGETIQVSLSIVNTGGGDLLNAMATLVSYDTNAILLTSPIAIDTLTSYGSMELAFQVQITEDAPIGYLLNLQFEVSGDHGFYFLDSVPVYIGKAVETFEAGNFEWLGWEMGGNNTWFIDTGGAMEGTTCARSGYISDNQMAWMRLFWDVAVADSISFWYKVESQIFYDYLRFNTLQGERGRWSGYTGWQRASISVPAGPNLFTWMYRKNGYYGEGRDCAWVDYIVFPLLNGTISTKQTDINTAKLWLYPNPSCDRLIIKYSLPESSEAVITINDMHGRCVFRVEDNYLPAGEYTLTPALENLKAGTYTVNLRTGSGSVGRTMIKSDN